MRVTDTAGYAKVQERAAEVLNAAIKNQGLTGADAQHAQSLIKELTGK